MATRLHFTDVEWRTVRGVPAWVGVAMSLQAASGFLGQLKEGVSHAGAVVEAGRSSNPLVADVATSADQRAAQTEVAAFLKGVDAFQAPATIRARALEEVGRALALVDAKTMPADAAAYRELIRSIAQRVANAAVERGERVSPPERAFLDDLERLLGPAPA